VFEHLTDVKKCNEEFKVADGKVSRCLAMGKMPVLAKDSNGKIYRFVLTDVRYVPDFKYTLVSVKQIWNDQRIDAQFADKNCLSFPGSVGVTIPFDNQHKLFTVTLVSEPLLLKTLQASRLSRTRTQPVHVCCLGFHNVKSISHVAHLPIAQASELIHRRCHFGVNKLRVLPHTSGDAPKILTSAVAGFQSTAHVHCAAAQIRRAGHSSTLSTPDPEPGPPATSGGRSRPSQVGCAR